MTRTKLLQELRRMRLEEAYGSWEDRLAFRGCSMQLKTGPNPTSVPKVPQTGQFRQRTVFLLIPKPSTGALRNR